MDLLLLIFFSYQLYSIAQSKGVSARPYLLNFIAGVVVAEVLAAYAIIYFMGGQVSFFDPEVIKISMYVSPFLIAFQIFLFIFLRKRLQKQKPQIEDDFDDRPQPPVKEKKDLSYFR
jgi:hypothetical protein